MIKFLLLVAGIWRKDEANLTIPFPDSILNVDKMKILKNKMIFIKNTLMLAQKILLGVLLIFPQISAAGPDAQTPRSTLAQQQFKGVEAPWAEKKAFEKQTGRSWQEASLEEKQKFIQRYRRDEERRIRLGERQRQKELKDKERGVHEIHRKHARLQRDEAKKEKEEARNFQTQQREAQQRSRQLQRQANKTRTVRVRPVRVPQENPSSEDKK